MRRLALALLVLFWASPAWAGYTSCGTHCYQADTTGSADVQAALDASQAASGGIVMIPAGLTAAQVQAIVEAALREHEAIMAGPLSDLSHSVAKLRDDLDAWMLAQGGEPEQQTCHVPPQPWPVEINGGRLLVTLKGTVGPKAKGKVG